VEDFTGFGDLEDNGINVLGRLRGAREEAMAFIGLGEGEAAEQFKRSLRQAIKHANTI
jgi:hypothetical protein